MPTEDTRIQALIAARQTAEQVVADMDEGPLKERAFEAVLRHLLAENEGSAGQRRKATRSRAKPSHQKVVRRATSPMKRLEELAVEGFFAEARSLPDIVERMRAGGHNYKQDDLSKPLQRLTQAKTLRRELRDRGGRKIWHYQSYP